ncbi:hypothetical protein QJ850_gp808 [Acanthamoeba polyphaga mimivirus]|uniref:Uncharacterized protein n=1 Tax=Acanthamoeba polyphaga mimivirus Kroon TaxID=3069720 RepID=A0A0G2Y9T9_9VIRU|nr:hypothetical protein QJ850_gp808 [Acanthamoeba polyphaga mimivirus]AKI79891.1 hypothetical protein [Acanthamoeba polyphaga mimivirus Kroon]
MDHQSVIYNMYINQLNLYDCDYQKINMIEKFGSTIIVDQHVIVDTINSIKTDSYKIDALKLLLPMFMNPKLDILLCVIDTINSDSYKIDAIKTLLQYCLEKPVDINIIEKYICCLRGDSYRLDAIERLHTRLSTMDYSTVQKIIVLVMSDSYKLDALKKFSHNLEKQDTIKTINFIKSDSYKLDYILFIVDTKYLSVEESISLIDFLESNSYKSTYAEKIINTNSTITFNQIVQLTKDLPDTYRLGIADSFVKQLETFDADNTDNFCKNLGKLTNCALYNQTVEKLKIDKTISDKYKPRELTNSTSISIFNLPVNSHNPLSINLIGNISPNVGTIIYKSIEENNGITTVTIKYSNGSSNIYMIDNNSEKKIEFRFN